MSSNGEGKRPRISKGNDDEDAHKGTMSALDRVVMKSLGSTTETKQSFLRSATWKGSRPGYYFGTGEQGTGYYLDHTTLAGEEGMAPPAAKRPRRTVQIAEDRNETRVIPAALSAGDELLRQAEEEARREGQAKNGVAGRRWVECTPQGVIAAATALRKALERNELNRAQHGADQPQLYMESEVALYEHIQSLQAFAADPQQLYPIILVAPNNNNNNNNNNKTRGGDDNNHQLVPTLMQLLLHDNPDVAASVVALLLEWLDVSLLQDPETGHFVAPVAQLTAAVIDQGTDYLVANLARLRPSSSPRDSTENGNDDDDDEEENDDDVGKGAEDILTLFENWLEMDLVLQQQQALSEGNDNLADFQLVSNKINGSVAVRLTRNTGLVTWLFQQIEGYDHGSTDKTASTALRSRALELLALLAPREDVHSILPDWSKLPRYTSMFLEDQEIKPGVHKISDDGSKESTAPATVDGIEILLQTAAAFRKKQPEDEAQVDILENTSLIMASALTYSHCNVSAFVQAQGVELVVRCLKERVHAAATTLEWLDFEPAITTTTTREATEKDSNQEAHPAFKQASEQVVHAGALKYLFPLFMGRNLPRQGDPTAGAITAASRTSSKRKKAKKEWNASIERTTIRVFYALVRHLTDDSPQDAKARFLAKFVGHEKCDRIVELLMAYDQKAQWAEYKYHRDVAATETDEAEQEEPQETAAGALEAKLAGGGDIFHRLGALAAFCCVGSKRCHERILSQLHQQGSGMDLIRSALQEFISLLDETSIQRKQLQDYLDKIV